MRENGVAEEEWSKRGRDLRLDTCAEAAVKAIAACRDDRAIARFLRRLADHLDDMRPKSGSKGPSRAA